LTTAEQLEGLGVTAAALAGGLISEAEAGQIASAASVDHNAEAELLAAGRDSHKELRDKAARRRAAALGDEGRDERLRAGRRLTDWTDPDGATCVKLRLAPVDGARLLAAVDARAQDEFKAAYRDGRREGLTAYRADALLSLVRDGATGGGGGKGVEARVNVHIDYAALVRGRTLPGETCHIRGVGPVSVATARALLGDAVLNLIVTDGVDVYNVVRAGRFVPAHVQTALEVRDPQCCRPTCGQQQHLQNHHYKIDYAQLNITRLSELARLCPFDHRLITDHKARLDGGPGHWQWTNLTDGPPPPPPPDPDPPPQAAAARSNKTDRSRPRQAELALA
jgi:hypothetical protein